MEKKRIILLEFNELCPDLLTGWMAEGQLPNFKTFYESSQVFTTEADETGPPYLEPWIQWYSIHTGLSFRNHKVFYLTEGPKAGHTDIWQLLRESGKTICNFSSMNAKGFCSPGSVFLPDPWCTSEKAFPEELNIFSRFVAARVHEYTKGDGTLSFDEYIQFFRFLLFHGLRVKTLIAATKQLASDTFTNGHMVWKRAVLLDKLQFDVFRYYQKKLRPDFSTFFINSTAHYQHAYWRHMSPESFTSRPQQSEIATYRNAILYGYQEMDRLLGDFFRFENEGVMLILATALSQQPFLKGEAYGGQHFYRPRDVESLLKTLNIAYDRIVPVMAHQYVVHFKDKVSTENALKVLKSLTYDGTEIFGFAESGPNSLYFGNQIHSVVPENARVEIEERRKQSFSYYDLFYKFTETKSGCHHPDGVLWFKTGKHEINAQKVSILDIFPTILNYYNIRMDSNPGEWHQGNNLLRHTS